VAHRAVKDVDPGKSFSFSFVANDPGVFMYHCRTKPALMHIANGMYGAIVVDPTAPLPHADRQYVLVSSEWYLNAPGLKAPASFDLAKAHSMAPDWVTWNGFAGQYVEHPLTANPGETVGFWVVAAGPSFDTDFHVVGTLVNRRGSPRSRTAAKSTCDVVRSTISRRRTRRSSAASTAG